MNLSKETMELFKVALANPSSEIAKAFTQGSTTQATAGSLMGYDLEAPSKKMYPVLTPLRNTIARVKAGIGSQANWKAITAINPNLVNIGVSEGKRGGTNAVTIADYLAAYVGMGLEDYVTFEADYAAEGFEDVKATAVESLLRATMIAEEKIILGGLGTWELAQPTGLSLTAATTGGAITGTTSPGTLHYVAVAPLTLDGYGTATVAGGVPISTTRTNIDSTTDTYNGGTGKVSANATCYINNTSAGKITATCTAVKGAAAYAWFVGISATDSYLTKITTVNKATFTAIGASGAATSAYFGRKISDLSTTVGYGKNTLIFDGLLSQAAKTSSGAYIASLDGAGLTADGKGGITELDVALASFWDNYKLSPDEMWVSSQEQKNIRAKILTGSATAAQRFVFSSEQGKLTGGSFAASYLNPFSMSGAQEIPIKLHPNMPPGTIMFRTVNSPYKLSGVGNLVQMKLRRDYYQIEWPLRTRRYEYGVYFDGVLQNYFPPAFGVISNIGDE